MSLSNPPFMAVFGAGAPGAGVPKNANYYDNTTNPYTPYIYSIGAGAWKKTGAGTSSTPGDATTLQGRAISAAAPANGQVLTWVAANNDWEPLNPTGGAVPSIVQTKGTCNGSGYAITLAGAPTQGNLLVALTAAQDINPGAAAGWTKSPYSIGSAAQDNAMLWYKIAGAGESATQTPSGSGTGGNVQMWELANAALSVPTLNVDQSGTSVTFQEVSQRGTGAIMIGAFINRSASVAPSSIVGATAGTITQANNRTIAPWLLSSPIVGNNPVQVNYGSSQGFVNLAVVIG